jgi:hypothetical protein
MRRGQPTLHVAMKTILLDQPDHIATFPALSEENAKRDLFRRNDGDYPQPFQLGLRARKHPEWFLLLPQDRVQYIGP